MKKSYIRTASAALVAVMFSTAALAGSNDKAKRGLLDGFLEWVSRSVREHIRRGWKFRSHLVRGGQIEGLGKAHDLVSAS